MVAALQETYAPRPLAIQYFYSIAAVVVVSSLCFLFSNFIGYKVVALLLLLAVSLLAISFDIYPVLLAAASSAAIWNFFFIPPRYTIHIESTEDTILLIMYFIIAMINGVLTNRIRKAEKAARLKEERANSVKLYNTILNSLSHELRTPIAAIIGAADNLRFNTFITEEDKGQLIGEISKAALRLNQQVENLLHISRLESGHIQPKRDWCDVAELVYEVVRQVEESNPGCTIGISTKQDLSLCYIDKGMLQQVLYNLLNNASIHTPKGTRIDITATCHADLLEFFIEDSGPGFTELDKEEVFYKLSRDKERSANGSGLGLSIVRGFTEALNGSVQLTKTALGGAAFIITFPVKTTNLQPLYE